MRDRLYRTTAVIAAVVFATSCTNSVGGAPTPFGASSNAPERTADPGSALLLEHTRGSGAPKKMGNLVLADACNVITMDDLEHLGWKWDVGAPARLESERFISDGYIDEKQLYRDTSPGTSKCLFWGANSAFVHLTIYQRPFDVQREQQSAKDTATKKTLDNINATLMWKKKLTKIGLPTHAIRDNKDGNWTVVFMAKEAWAELFLAVGRKGAPMDTPEKFIDRLSQHTAERLIADDAGPASFRYKDNFSDVPAPCDLYTTDHFKLSYGEPDLGRVKEAYTLFPQRLQGAGDTAHFGTSWYMATSCSRRNQTGWIGGFDGNGMEVEFSFFDTDEGANNSNDYKCNGTRKYRHPFGEPTNATDDKRKAFGDGFSCFEALGNSSPPLIFKVKNVVVSVTPFDESVYKSKDRLTAVFETSTQALVRSLEATLK